MGHVPDLGSWLRAHAGDEAELRLPRATVKALADELQQLRQSADRLRKQNKKLRARLARSKGAGGIDGGDDPGDVTAM